MQTTMKFESKTKMLPKGTICILSERRENNLVYPSDTATVLELDALIDELSWPIYNGLVAIAVLSTKLKNPPWSKPDRKIVVWINPKEILRF